MENSKELTNHPSSINQERLAFAMELYWLNNLKKNNILDDDEYYKIKADIYKKYRKVNI